MTENVIPKSFGGKKATWSFKKQENFVKSIGKSAEICVIWILLHGSERRWKGEKEKKRKRRGDLMNGVVVLPYNAGDTIDRVCGQSGYFKETKGTHIVRTSWNFWDS